MSVDAQTARDCFAENFKFFGSDPVNTMEKFNLYTGLTKLADAISSMDNRLSQIESELRQIRFYIQSRG